MSPPLSISVNDFCTSAEGSQTTLTYDNSKTCRVIDINMARHTMWFPQAWIAHSQYSTWDTFLTRVIDSNEITGAKKLVKKFAQLISELEERSVVVPMPDAATTTEDDGLQLKWSGDAATLILDFLPDGFVDYFVRQNSDGSYIGEEGIRAEDAAQKLRQPFASLR